MKAKASPPSRKKANAPSIPNLAGGKSAHRRRKSSTSPSQHSAPVFGLSLSVGPLVAIVSRHVKVSEKARQAIERDLAEALGHARVTLSVASTMQSLSGAEADDPVLTTEQAAQLVGVSRPFMVKLIDSGAVALHQMVGNQRRLLRSAVLRWSAAERSRQDKALKRLAEDIDDEIS